MHGGLQVFDDYTIMTVFVHILHSKDSQHSMQQVKKVERTWLSCYWTAVQAWINQKWYITYRLAFTQTLRERVCVAQWISMWIPQDIVDYHTLELHYRLEYVVFRF